MSNHMKEINSNYIKNLYITPETLKSPEGTKGIIFRTLVWTRIFFFLMASYIGNRPKTDKGYPIKLKCF